MSSLAKIAALIVALALFACSAGTGNDAISAGDITVTEFNATLAHDVGHYGYGKTAVPEEIAGWDIDIRPDGLGLPPGGGTPEDGEMLYEDQCAWCHGSFGEGVGRYPVLAGGEDTLTEARPEKTVGSFWPYASTLWDYIHRAMPFAEPESLSDDEVYAISAYVLYLNDLVEYDFELNQDNLASIEMPNQDGFFRDDRPDVVNERCMSNCKDPSSIVITSEQQPPENAAADAVSAVTTEPAAGETIYQQACALCHASGIGDAPVLGDHAAWSQRLATGREALVASSIGGIGVMPPKGGQLQLSDADVVTAVDFMIEQATSQRSDQ